MSGTDLRRSRRRRRLLAWIPTVVVVLVCVAFFWGAYAMSQSWWVAEDPPPSADQATTDGQSMFSQAGVDYLTRQGVMTVVIGPDSASAATLSLESGSTDVEPRTPVRVVVRAPAGEWELSTVSRVSLDVRDDVVESIRIVRPNTSGWRGALGLLRHDADAWGWSAADVDALESDLGGRIESGLDPVNTGVIPEADHFGARVGAEVVVTTTPPSVVTTYRVSRAD